MPFDFSRGAIEVEVTVHGTVLHALVDTGVNPSVIDLQRATALGLAVDRSDPGQASGFGNGQGAAVFPSAITGLALGGRAFAGIDALAVDMSTLSARYGRPLDAVLGASFLQGQRVLIDYPRRRLTLLPPGTGTGTGAATRACRVHWSVPLRVLDDSYPLIPAVRIGSARAPATLDTGYNGGIALFGHALDLPGVRAGLAESGTVEHAGARGDARSTRYTLALPVGIGPFTLPPGQQVIVHAQDEPAHRRAANLGNRVFDQLQVQVLLDAPARTLGFFGQCG